MKRRIALLLLVLTLLTAFAMPALAYADPETVEEVDVTAQLSEDLQQVQMDGVTYVRFNANRTTVQYDFDMIWYNVTVELSDTQKQTIDKVLIDETVNGVTLSAQIHYKDGAVLNVDFLRQDLVEVHRELMATNDCIADFYNPEGNQIEFPLDAARGEEEILFRDDLYTSSYRVNAVGQDGLAVKRGLLLILSDEYYYVDYDEAGTTDLYELERFKAWRITDEALCADIAKAMEEYYGSDLGFLESEDFSEQVSKALLIMLFVVIPGAVLILFLILAIRAKTPVYKKLFWNLCIWSALVLIVAATVILVVQLN